MNLPYLLRKDIPFPFENDGSLSESYENFKAKCKRFHNNGIKIMAVTPYPKDYIEFGADFYTYVNNNAAEAAIAARTVASNLDSIADVIKSACGIFLIGFGLLSLCCFAMIISLFYEYFNAIIEMLNWGNFDVLAHLTYPLRYFYSQSNLDIDLNKFQNQIDEILLLTAKSGKALEINTAGLRQPINKLSPEVDIVKRFKELGGKYVTVGSDAHYAEHLAADIDMAYSCALEAGFDCITFFQKRTPIEMKIEVED